MNSAPFWLDQRPATIDLRYCAALQVDGSQCRRKAEVMPRIVGWPANLPPAYWNPDNAVGIVLELPICARCQKQYSMVEAYIQPRNWRVLVEYAQMAKRPVPHPQSLMVEFVKIDHLDERRAAAAH